MYDSLFDITIKRVQSWSPEREYPKEPDYSDDLWRFLSQRISSATVTRDDKNDKKGLDLGIRQDSMYGIRSVGIELKRNFKSARGLKELVGQLETKGRHYDDIIILFIGETSNNMIVKTREWIRGKADPITGISSKHYKIIIKGSKIP
ncbi:MAG: hypothetical protein KA818_04805 [Methanoculleus sp.]|nr:hypothetical protein [Methanoculleus sp.]